MKLDWKKNPETGRMTMTEIEGSEYIVDCDVDVYKRQALYRSGCHGYQDETAF